MTGARCCPACTRPRASPSRQRRTSILIPKDAVATRDGKRIVQKVQGDAVSIVEVVEGLADGTRVEIVKGLAAGDTVFADARRQLATGSKVRGINQF